MAVWKLFKGDRKENHEVVFPDAPPWRRFGEQLEDSPQNKKGAKYVSAPDVKDIVNAALLLRRPLLITGKPGTGKSSIAHAVAHELCLGEVLIWPITTKTSLKDGLYRYDAIGRAQDERKIELIDRYIKLGALGTAFIHSEKPRVLLIDEIDKCDIDLPNDLLHIFEEGEFEIPELERISGEHQFAKIRTAYKKTVEPDFPEFHTIDKGKIRCKQFPFIVMTSNDERQFPPAFLRRCLQLSLKEPGKKELFEIISQHLPEMAKSRKELIDGIIDKFHDKREKGELSTDQLLNALYLINQENGKLSEEDEKKALDMLLTYIARSRFS